MTAQSKRQFGFFRDESGSGSVEACLWLPVLVGFFILIFDASYVFLRDGEIRRVLAEGNRQYVRGLVGTEPSDLETWIETQLSQLSPNADAVSTVDASNGLLTTTVTYPASDTDITGWISALTGLVITAQVVNQTEV